MSVITPRDYTPGPALSTRQDEALKRGYGTATAL
jgi:hypothetical protein